MRILPTQFLSELKSGHLLPLLERVKFDFDLDLNIQDRNLNKISFQRKTKTNKH